MQAKEEIKKFRAGKCAPDSFIRLYIEQFEATMYIHMPIIMFIY